MLADIRSAVFAAALLLSACEKPFEPLAPTDLVFSIYGHLDAAADTQWVRVMPIRPSAELLPGPIDAVVTLEELETGSMVVMEDSLFRYLPLLGDTDLYAHNFSTTMPMVPGRHYRLTATRSDGATAVATVLIPTFEDPTMEVSYSYRAPASVNSRAMSVARGAIRNTRYLGMVLGREDIPSRCGWPFPIHQQFLPVFRPASTDGEDHLVQLSWSLDESEPTPSYVVGHPPMIRDTVEDHFLKRSDLCNLGPKRVLAIATGAEWPYDTRTGLRELTHPTEIDNIEGSGIGFLAGVHTHVFPFAACTPLDRSSPCTITFSPRSATLTGMVTNRCTGEALDNIRVRLVSAPTNTVRYDTTDVAGVFRFQGLEPGLAHPLELSKLPGRDDVGGPDFDPVQFGTEAVSEGAGDTVRIGLSPRRNGC